MGFVLAAILAAPLSAQWLDTPTPGVPRGADGKPDLSAPAPRAADGHPDLSGVWMPNTRSLQDLAADPDVLRHTGTVIVAASLASEYGFTDIDGTTPRPLTLADV